MSPRSSISGPSKTAILEQDLENRILHGLSLEWESALLNLSAQDIRAMKKPLFALKDGEHNLAQWHAERREITFSRNFVNNYPWDSVREVLVHEMAHQYTHEVLKCRDETAHGPSFRKACRILRANPEASGSYRPLTDRIEDPGLSHADKTLVKIKKLLALGESSNPHEAEAALLKAQVLIDRFNVDLSKKGPAENGFISMFVGKPALRRFKEDYLLARLLVDHYFVYGIWVSSYVLEKGKMGRVFEITGRPENVKTAAYVHDFIINQTNLAWQDVNKTGELNRYRKSDFSFGLIQGFSDRLAKENKGTKDSTTFRSKRLPMTLDREALMEYAAHKYPRIRRFSRSTGSMDGDILSQGKKVGENLALAKGLEKDSTPKPKKLPRHTQ